MSHLPAASVDLIQDRLVKRARLIGRASDEDVKHLEYLFGQAELLGNLLQAARQGLEASPEALTIEPVIVPAAPSLTTLWLWEQGLAMPDEINSGHVTALIRWYVDHLRYQREDDPTKRLARDMMALYTELRGANPLEEEDRIEDIITRGVDQEP